MSTEALDKRAERVNYILKNGGELRTEMVIGLIDDLRAALAAPQAQPEQAAQAQPKAWQNWRMRLAAIAAECSDPDTTDALDALLSETDAPSPAALATESSRADLPEARDVASLWQSRLNRQLGLRAKEDR